MTPAARLDRLIQFRRATLDTASLEQREIWADHGRPIWGSKTDIRDSEKWRAAQVQAEVTTRFLVRWSEFTAGITPRDRLICDGREYHVAGVPKEVGRREWVEITAAAEVE